MAAVDGAVRIPTSQLLTNAALSFIEPLLVGLIITLISAAILRKKARSEEVGA
jgi:hypothetical protein